MTRALGRHHREGHAPSQRRAGIALNVKAREIAESAPSFVDREKTPISTCPRDWI
jgi:hypothetical protein